MASITYTYYVKYTSSGYYVATYYLHTQPVYTKDSAGNVLSSPAPYSANSYGYDYVKWSGGSHLTTTYTSSLPSAYFDGATTYSGDSGSTVILTYATDTSSLTDIFGTFEPTERFAWAYGTPAPTTSTTAPTTSTTAPTTSTTAVVTMYDGTFCPTLAPLATVKEKSLDFSFSTNSYAFTHLQKHGDTKHATLTITDSNNILFNGQLLGDSVSLPTYVESSGVNPYANYGKNIFASYAADYLAYNINIHTFRGERLYSTSATSNNAYNTAFGIITHRSDRGPSAQYTNSYAYIFNFDSGRLTSTIIDMKQKKILSVNAFGGDRLIWDSNTDKYIINQFGSLSVTSSYTDPIPTSTASKNGLMSKSSYSYVFSETGKLRTDVDALKKVTQAPCAYYVDVQTSPLFYQSVCTGIQTTTYKSSCFWSDLINECTAVKRGLQIIGYIPDRNEYNVYTYITVSTAYLGNLVSAISDPVSGELMYGYCLKTQYTYNDRIYRSNIYMSSNLFNTSSTKALSYMMIAYVSPLNMQEITSSNEGTFTK